MLRTSKRTTQLCALPLLVALLAFAGACDSGHGHPDMSRLELVAHGDNPVLIAVWTDTEGWRSPSGDVLDALPASVQVGEDDPVALRSGGAPAVLHATAFTSDAETIPMQVLETNPETGEPLCTESSLRYEPLVRDTNVLQWPAIAHPESSARRPPALFVETGDGLEVAFSCDRVILHPNEAGTVQVRFLLWHLDHADAFSDPITVRVEPAE